ncbi:MAG: acyltransferase family protein [Candidatus Binatia bacterium]
MQSAQEAIGDRVDLAERSRALDHLPALDGVRGIAILLVVLFHSLVTVLVRVRQNLFDRLWGQVFGLGYCGVDLFFVLSGFLITRILLHSRNLPQGQYLKRFYVRRVLRIFPLYYLCLILALVVLPLLYPLVLANETYRKSYEHQRWYWFYVQNLYPIVDPEHQPLLGLLSHFWSLSIEEQYYLVWPFVVGVFRRSWQLVGFCLALCFLSFVFRVGLLLCGSNQLVPYFLTPGRLDSIAAGSMIAILMQEDLLPRALLVRVARQAVFAGLGLLVGTMVWQQSVSPFKSAMAATGSTAFALLFGGWLILVLTRKPDSGVTHALMFSPLRAMGKYSYGIYVFHWPVCMWVHGWLPGSAFPRVGGSAVVHQATATVVILALSTAFAVVSYHLFEQRFLALKSRFAEGNHR